MTEAAAWQQAKETLDALKLKHNRQLNLFFESVDELNEVVLYSQVGSRCNVAPALYVNPPNGIKVDPVEGDVRSVVIVITNFALYAFPPMITLEDGTEFLVLSDHERFLLQDVALCCTPFSTSIGPDGLDYALRSDDFVLYQISGQMAWFRAIAGERSPLVEVLCESFLALMGQEMEVRQVDHDELVTTLLNHVPLDPEEEPKDRPPAMQGYMEFCCVIEGLDNHQKLDWTRRWFVLARDRDQDFLFHFPTQESMEAYRIENIDRKDLYDFRTIPANQRISLATVILKRVVSSGYITGFELVSQAQTREQRSGRRASAVHVYPMRFLFCFPETSPLPTPASSEPTSPNNVGAFSSSTCSLSSSSPPLSHSDLSSSSAASSTSISSNSDLSQPHSGPAAPSSDSSHPNGVTTIYSSHSSPVAFATALEPLCSTSPSTRIASSTLDASTSSPITVSPPPHPDISSPITVFTPSLPAHSLVSPSGFSSASLVSPTLFSPITPIPTGFSINATPQTTSTTAIAPSVFSFVSPLSPSSSNSSSSSEFPSPHSSESCPCAPFSSSFIPPSSFATSTADSSTEPVPAAPPPLLAAVSLPPVSLSVYINGETVLHPPSTENMLVPDTPFGQKPQAMEWASRIDRALYVRDIAVAKERSKEKKQMSKKDRKKEEKARQKERKQIEAEQYAAYQRRRSSEVVKFHTQADGDRLRAIFGSRVNSGSSDDLATPSRSLKPSLLTRLVRNSTTRQLSPSAAATPRSHSGPPAPFRPTLPPIETKPASSPMSVKPTLAIKPPLSPVSMHVSSGREGASSPVNSKYLRRRDSAQFQANPANLYNMKSKNSEAPGASRSRSPSLADLLSLSPKPPPLPTRPPPPLPNVVTVHYSASPVANSNDEWFKDCGFSSIQEHPLKDVP